VVDKPAGPTSHDIVDRVRKALGVRRVGHTGTLDPFATGVLVVCVGKATRLARFLAEGPKTYHAVVRLGFATTTDDLTGEPLGPAQAVEVDRKTVEQVAQRFEGEISQVPPAFAAKRLAGKRLYQLARQGQRVEVPATPVSIHRLDVLGVAGGLVEIELACSPGTYVRALARDLGVALGTGGHLESLRRLRSGEFGIEDALPGEEIAGVAAARLLPLAALLRDLPAASLTDGGMLALRHGREIQKEMVADISGDASRPRWRLTDARGDLCGLALLATAVASGPDRPVPWALHPDVVLLDMPEPGQDPAGDLG
jgi:tRNA pseudouridine55 synthase